MCRLSEAFFDTRLSGLQNVVDQRMRPMIANINRWNLNGQGVKPRSSRQAKNMKYAALTLKKNTNRSTLAAEIVVGITVALTRQLAPFYSLKQRNFFLVGGSAASAVPDCAGRDTGNKSFRLR